MTSAAAQTAPAAERNKEPILTVLRRVLPERGLVLEVASGTGQHVVHFAAGLPGLEWQPSEANPDLRASITAWSTKAGLANIRPPLTLDAVEPAWPIETADAVLCINMVHIAPWAATLGLLAGAARVLPPGGALVLYGPYRRSGAHTAPSNAAFDTQLRAQNPDWGVRDLETVAEAALRLGLALEEAIEMPANNLCLVLRLGPA